MAGEPTPHEARGPTSRQPKTAPSSLKQGARHALRQLLVILSAGLLVGCASNRESELPAVEPIGQPWLSVDPAAPPWNVLLITLDTTRRDRLGCYGHKAGTTPNLDALAAEGILFEHAITPVPITLPAHATIFTGRNPNEHGVRNNGTFTLAPEAVTIAEVLQARGYATGATVGAFPVSAQFGLAQGFDSYDDDVAPAAKKQIWGDVERPANEVTDRALARMGTYRDKPFFHWVHYFDPHSPYEPPPPYRQRFADPYDGEIAFMDSQIGRLIKGLEELGLRERTWILCVADHGEALGDHGEPTHSIFLYEAAQSVPCLLIPPRLWEALPSRRTRGVRVAEVVSSRDLAPTMLNALGLPKDLLPASGSSLLPLLAGEWDGPRVVYMETLAPFLEFGWCELRGVRTARWSYIRAPEPELYDLRADPGETTNLALRRGDVRERLDAWLTRFVDQGGQELSMRVPDAQTLARLRSLGYVGSTGTTGSSINDKDPKTLVSVLAKIARARLALEKNDMEAARVQYEEALAVDPDNPALKRELGAVHIALGQGEPALAILDQVLSRFPKEWESRLNRVRALALMKDFGRAETELKSYLAEAPDPGPAIELYARLLVQTGRTKEARALLERGNRAEPERIRGLVQLAQLEWANGNHERGQELARDVIAADSTQAAAWGLLGEWFCQKSVSEAAAGKPDAAQDLLRRGRDHLARALHLDPGEPMAAFRMGWLLSREGRLDEARQLYERSLGRQPNAPDTHYNLGNLLQHINQPAPALEHYNQALRLGMETVDLYINRGVALAMLGRREEAAAAWRRALELGPDPQAADGIRQNLRRLGY